MNWTLLTLFPLLMVCHLAPADDHRLPERFSADFELYTHGMTVARTHWSVEPAGDDSFVYESRTEPAGFYAMISNDRVLARSVWRYVGDRLRSLGYRYVRTGGKKERDIAIEFDWERNLAHNTANGDTWNMPIPAETLDKLNYVLAMMGDLAAGKQEIDYLVADGGKLKAYRLEQLGFETIETSIGVMETVKVQRIRKGKKRETYMWCAPSLAFLPVKIEHREKDGTVVVMSIRSVQGLGS